MGVSHYTLQWTIENSISAELWSYSAQLESKTLISMKNIYESPISLEYHLVHRITMLTENPYIFKLFLEQVTEPTTTLCCICSKWREKNHEYVWWVSVLFFSIKWTCLTWQNDSRIISSFRTLPRLDILFHSPDVHIRHTIITRKEIQ